MTGNALKNNFEWNTKFVSTANGEMTKQITSEFDRLWNSDNALPFDEFYENYKEKYNIIKHQRQMPDRKK